MLKSISKFAQTIIIFSSTSLLIGIPLSQAQMTNKCAASTSTAIANKIANGHAWKKHRSEFVEGKVIAGLAMPSSPKVKTVKQFQTLILSVMGAGDQKTLSAGRKAYWGSPTGTIVIYDPRSKDCGTTFRPVDGQRYYDRQN